MTIQSDKVPIHHKIEKDKALELFNSKWWLDKTPEEIVRFQLFTDRLCLPFDKFHQALESALNRPVWTHELAFNYPGICSEFLKEKPAPSMEEIMNLIPVEKRIIVSVQSPKL